MNHNRLSYFCAFIVEMAFLGLMINSSLQGAPYYWDSNAATAGAGVTPTGTWGTDAFWSTSSTGVAATTNTTTTLSDDLFFSAGNDTSGDYTVTLNGVQNAKSITAQTGNLILNGGNLALAKSTSNGGNYLVTTGTGNLTIDSTLVMDNSTTGTGFLNFNPAAGSTITMNGPITANTLNTGSGSTGNQIFLRHTGAGAVVINSNLGGNANLLSALNAATAIDGVSGSGSLALNGTQTLTGVSLSISTSGKTGTVYLGEVVTSSQVSMHTIVIRNNTANMAGATVNINSDVSLTSAVDVRNGGVINVAGKLSTTATTSLGIGASGNTYHGGAINILQGGTAELGNVRVGDNLKFTNAGTLTGTRLTLGENTGNTNGKFVVGDTTAVGLTTFTGLSTEGGGTENAIVGGNSAISTFILEHDSTETFSGKLGGEGSNENNLAFVKDGSGTLTLSGVNTYVGDTTINDGSFVLAEEGRLNFAIGMNGVNNGILGEGALHLNGGFTFDLSGAATVGAWNIVNVQSLTVSFSETFLVEGFTNVGGNKWEMLSGDALYTFDEVTGMLNAIPEPSTGVLLLGLGMFTLLHRYRKIQ